MTTLTHDAVIDPVARTRVGLVFAVASAVSFGLSGGVARGLLDTGWTPGAVVLIRIAIAAVVLAPFGWRSMRGRGEVVRRNVPLILLYGVLGVVAAQFCYYSAVQYMQVGPAILIECSAPAAVVVWLWLRHGQRPGPVTMMGALLAGGGLVLVLDVLGGTTLSSTGVLWALGAMVGATAFYLINGDDSTGLPPMALAWGGMVVGATFLGLLGLLGLMPLATSTAEVTLAGSRAPWWVPLVVLGVVSAAVAYAAAVAAGRLLGSRLASFVGLLEVVASVLFAWLLLHELPGPVQLVGGLLILAGVVAVKAGEQRRAAPDGAPVR